MRSHRCGTARRAGSGLGEISHRGIGLNGLAAAVDNRKVRPDARPADRKRPARAPRLLGAAAPALCALALGALALGALALCALPAAAPAKSQPFPGGTRLIHAPGKLVPIPASIPHEEGDMVDRRIIPDLRWLAARFPIYVTDAYSGPLPEGGHAGCRGCHVRNSDHHFGLAVDIVPRFPSTGCDARWRGITRLARFAEPRQNRPRPPFRWVGYDGDRGHGCGHHLHLSWNHGPAPEFQLAPWVEALPAALTRISPPPGQRDGAGGGKAGGGASGKGGARGPSGGAGSGRRGTRGAGKGRPGARSGGPTGGISQSRTGGIAPRTAGG